jgi:HEAT repeat protein
MPEAESCDADRLEETDQILEAIADLHATIYFPKRRAATARLIAIGAPAVAYLIEELGSKELVDREAIIGALVGIGHPAVKPLTEALLSKNLSVYEGARLALRQIDLAPAVESMRELLQREIAAIPMRKREWRLRILKRSCVVLVALALFVALCRLYPPLEHLINMLPQIVLWGIIGGSIDATVHLRRNAIDLLSYAGDVRMVGAFAFYLSDRNKGIRVAAANALKKLLPRVQASDKQYITQEEMDTLIRALGGKDHLLTIAILRALEQVGDEKALPKVERLAEDGSKPLEVHRAAEACLPYLRLRAQQAEQAQTLLRAASSTAVAPDTLLRPAVGSAPAQADQLLRPHIE